MLDFGNKQESSSISFLDGTFINVVRIVQAQDISKQDIFKNGTPIDCGVELTVDIGRDFQPKMSIYGNFKTEGTKLSWGSAFVVKDLLSQLGIKGELNEDGSIPQDVLEQLSGRQIIRLSFLRGYDSANNKKRYSDYKHIAVVDDFDNPETVKKAGQKLTNKFLKDVTAGWVKNFHPDAGK
jgi:hypothetical protein